MSKDLLSRSSCGPVFSLAGALLVCALPAAAQQGSSASAAITAPPAFEVTSVKPSKPDCPGMIVSSSVGRFSARCTTLLGLLYNAYPIKPNVPVPGLPGWASSVLFDVEAKASDNAVAAEEQLPRDERSDQKQQMLQALLADRFKLRVHTETREGAIYELVVAKGGFKLKDAPESELSGGYSWGRSQIQVRKGSIERLAFTLSDILSRTVVDKTGLTGNYDFTLKWTPDEQQGTADAGPTLFTALEEQMGLKVVPSKGPVDIFIVDYAERPSEN